MNTMATKGTAVVTLLSDSSLLITRTFNAPKNLVYKAFTTPELVKRWWSGERGEVTSAEIDLRAGGRWRYVMIAHEGFEVAFHGRYTEIVPNERVVSTEVFEGVENAEPSLNTMTLTELEDSTQMRILVEYPSMQIRDIVIASGMEAGMQEAMDKLERVAISLVQK